MSAGSSPPPGGAVGEVTVSYEPVVVLRRLMKEVRAVQAHI